MFFLASKYFTLLGKEATNLSSGNLVFKNKVPFSDRLSTISYLYIYSSFETTTSEGLFT